MRLKTLGVFVTIALSAFVIFYWVTDDARREAIRLEQEEDLAAFGLLVFSEDPSELAAAGCARCHGPEGQGGPVPGDPAGRQAPSLHTASLAGKLEDNPDYVRLAVSYGGVIVSGVPFPESPMPPWRDALNQQQLEAVVALVESWAIEAGEQAVDVPNTVEGGQQVFTSAGCFNCHGADLSGGVGPNLQTIGSELVTDGLPVPPSGLDQMIEDYEADPADFLAKWIRDSWTNYNGGTSTQMPQYPESQLSENNLQALITFLLAQTGAQ